MDVVIPKAQHAISRQCTSVMRFVLKWNSSKTNMSKAIPAPCRRTNLPRTTKTASPFLKPSIPECVSFRFLDGTTEDNTEATMQVRLDEVAKKLKYRIHCHSRENGTPICLVLSMAS